VTRVQFLAVTDFSHHHHIQNGYGICPASRAVDTGSSFPKDRYFLKYEDNEEV
jgi:hypothetical protein